MTHNKPIANSLVILREEFDDWAILFDPDANAGYAVDPVAVFIWKKLDGAHTSEDILEGLKKNFEDVPEDAVAHIEAFVEDLVKHGLVGYEAQHV
jgi:SynChlorMet cassette protein ScmD